MPGTVRGAPVDPPGNLKGETQDETMVRYKLVSIATVTCYDSNHTVLGYGTNEMRSNL